MKSEAGLSRRDFLVNSASALGLFVLNCCTSAKFSLLPQKWSSLRNALKGSDAILLVPGQTDFEKYKSVFNLRHRAEPQLIVRCASTDTVSRLVAWVSENKVPFRLRSGGHCYEGFSTSPSIVLDLRPMNTIHVNKISKTVQVGAGVLVGDVLDKLNPLNLGIPLGTCLGVGISGLTLGGGMGFEARKYGLTCDNLKAATCVLASGKIIRASATENADLFWALRGGGGGNFAVVTEFEFQTHPLTDVYIFNMKWKPSRAEEIMALWQDHFPASPAEVNSAFKIGGTQKDFEVQIFGQIMSKDGVSAPTSEETAKILQPFASSKPDLYKVEKRTHASASGDFFAWNPKPFSFKAKSHFAVNPIPLVGRKEMLKQLRETPPNLNAQITFDCFGGKIRESNSSFPYPKALFGLQYFSSWEQDSLAEPSMANLRRIHSSAGKFVGNRAYVNYCDLEIQDWAAAYYGENLARLLEVKQKYDPQNVFNFGKQSLSSLL
jgi:hypothetical protein